MAMLPDSYRVQDGCWNCAYMNQEPTDAEAEEERDLPWPRYYCGHAVEHFIDMAEVRSSGICNNHKRRGSDD